MTNTALSQQQMLESYYADNAKKLHRTVDRILYKFGGLYGKDKDDFYSLANEVFVDVLKRYDHKQPFDGFLYSCLSNKIMTEVTRRNREKRRADRMAVSLDAVNNDGEECSLLDLIPSDFDTFEEASKGQEDGQYNSKVQRYISGLSTRQVNILNLLIDGYEPYEIRRILEISPKEYSDSLNAMRSYSSELRGLRWEDIDLPNRTIHIKRNVTHDSNNNRFITGELKTSSGLRDIPMTQAAYDVLIALKHQQTSRKQKVASFEFAGHVFLNRNDRLIPNSNYDRYLEKLCAKAGIEKISMHTLRHTFATRCIESGMKPKTLQKILGHANISMTMDLYVHVTEDEKEKEMKKFEEMCNAV